jgi:hypothetical protein
MPEWLKWENIMARTLKDHEEVCSYRYENIERRLTSVEDKIDGIHKEIDGFKTFIVKLAIKSFGGLILAISAAVFVIKF